MKEQTAQGPVEPTSQGPPIENRRLKRGRGTILILRVTGGRDILKYTSLPYSGLVTLGRDPHCNLCLTDSSVTRRHAGIHYQDGQFIVEDFGSRNGTFVNGHKIKSSPLALGDHLEIGTIPLRMEIMTREELAQYQKALQRLERSGLDPLTSLYTRAFFDDHLQELLDQHKKADTPISAIFIDIDHFKTINDRFGHAVGDDVLKQIARLVFSAVRKADICVRYGGEEIVVIMEDTPEPVAAQVAERFRCEVQNFAWSKLDPELNVTVSGGVAQCRPEDGIREWLNQADYALYTAKRSGRNQIAPATQALATQGEHGVL